MISCRYSKMEVELSQAPIFLYDHTFEGLLTCIFESYAQRSVGATIIAKSDFQGHLFAQPKAIKTDAQKSARVWNGLKNKISTSAQNSLVRCFLSELPQKENVISGYIQYALSNKENIATDYGNKYVLELSQICKMMGREKHRMEAFVRFQKLKDESFFAVVEPDFNVLPLIAPHFHKRYADQKWIIYDIKRKYGISYDLEKVTTISLDFELPNISPEDVSAIYDDGELLYQTLWKAFFTSVNIKERKNMKLHLRSLPHRYWKYLTEKQL